MTILQVLALALVSAVSISHAAPCADFTGNWKGSCRMIPDDGKTYVTFEEFRQQECRKLEWWGDKYEFGKLNSYTYTHDGIVMKNETLLVWTGPKSFRYTEKYTEHDKKTGKLLALLLDSETFQLTNHGTLNGSFTQKVVYEDGSTNEEKGECLLNKKNRP